MSVPIFPFSPRSPSAVAIEVHALSERHPAQRMGAHGHAFHEIILITAGEGSVDLAGRTFPTTAGSAVLIPPGLVHDVRKLRGAGGWMVMFAAGSEAGLASQGGGPIGMVFDPLARMARASAEPLRLAPAAMATLAAFTERMNAELRSRPAGYAASVRAMLELLLVGLARAMPEAWRLAEAPTRERSLIELAFADIDRHFQGGATLREAADRLGLSPGYLTTRLRRLTGRTYGDWLIERRMMEARRLLAASDLSIGDIADRLGYAEIESFVRRFRERHGASPGMWREQLLGTTSPAA